MNKKLIYLFLGILIVLLGVFLFTKEEKNNPNVVVVGDTPQEIEGTTWEWVYTELLSGNTLNAPEGGQFVLSFTDDGKVNSTTDCNNMFGSYVRDGEVLSFSPFAMTKKYCEGSLESEYAQQLSLTNSFVINDDELSLILNRDFGVMLFTRK